MTSLLETGQRFLQERDPVALLRQVCHAASEMTDATIAGVAIVGEAEQTFEHLIAVGADTVLAAELIRRIRLSDDARRSLATRRSARGTDHADALTAIGLTAEHASIHSFILTPLASPSRVYGWLALLEKSGGTFSAADERIATTLGAQAGMAYENVSLVARLIEQTNALRDHEDDMEFAMSVARVGVSYRDIASEHLILSRSLAGLLGLPPGTPSIARTDFFAMIHPDDIDRVRGAVGDAIAAGAEFELEYRIQVAAGGWRWFRSNGRVTNKRGTARLFSGMTDVTEHRLLELQLHHGQKMEAIGQLAGGVAHDFNNLLTAVSGYADFLLESVEDPGQRRDVEEIVKAAARAASLTRQLLAFSRRQVMNQMTADVNALVEDMAAMLRRLIGEGIELTTDLSHDKPAVRVDRGQLEQVVMNLIVNARDATIGGGCILIETGCVEIDAAGEAHGGLLTPGHYVAVVVSDNGCGMTEETKAHLFEPFFTTKALGLGTGLGLATVYGIVTQSGGSISVTSQLGVGSTFTVLLPRHDHDSETAPQGTPCRPAGGTETILLAEDEHAVRALTRTILERAGYTVVDAGSPAEAERQSAGMPAIDLLLTDVVMPGGTGPDLFRRLSETHPELRVLFMSGYADRDLFDRADVSHAAAFLAKPFSGDALVAKVRDVIDRVEA